MSNITSTPRSISFDSYSTGMNEMFPTIPTISFDGQTPEFIAMLQEDRIRVMHKRTIALFNENASLKGQICQESLRVKDLEEKLLKITQTFSMRKNDENKQRENIQTAEAAVTLPLNTLEKLQQTMWAVCKSCHRKLQKNELQEPVVFITKTELEILESDIRTLHDTLATKEQAWNKIVDREQNYYRQLTRLTQEVITANQLTNNRYEELQKLAEILEVNIKNNIISHLIKVEILFNNTCKERECELKNGRREISQLKKIIIKQEKRYRAIDNRCDTNAVAKVEINERERKWIEGIMQQISSPRHRQKSIVRHQNSSRLSSNRHSARDMSIATKE
ncbi:hypothetical protein PV327_004579 [Microctonus hyperodae]|uniref:Uncharacterized protein n=1 Tax=Microctonus hyperodae TaxID=165561 RepID=A0AA39FCR3_MICHY|nr:hypothetical protein PV327_004579 [Microctonus hyperodae]